MKRFRGRQLAHVPAALAWTALLELTALSHFWLTYDTERAVMVTTAAVATGVGACNQLTPNRLGGPGDGGAAKAGADEGAAAGAGAGGPSAPVDGAAAKSSPGSSGGSKGRSSRRKR